MGCVKILSRVMQQGGFEGLCTRGSSERLASIADKCALSMNIIN